MQIAVNRSDVFALSDILVYTKGPHQSLMGHVPVASTAEWATLRGTPVAGDGTTGGCNPILSDPIQVERNWWILEESNIG